MKFAVIMLAVIASINTYAVTTMVGGPLGKKYSTGYVKPKNHGFGMPYFKMHAHQGTEDAAAPEQFDWRDEGVETPVRNQGNCGSCWAFASTQTLEGAAKRAGKDIDLSEQQVTSCYTKAYACNGGWFAGELLVKPGLTTEEEYPYTATSSRCRTNIHPVEHAVSYGYVGQQGRKPTTEEVKEAIMQYGHVSVTVAASNAWGNYKGGVFNRCSGGQTNHMVTLVGWEMVNNKTVWHMKNSWGVNWGDKGYMKIPEGCDRIAEEAAFITYENTPVEVPKVALPAEIMVDTGVEIVLAVKKQNGVTYSWYEGAVKLGDGDELIRAYTKDTAVKVVAKNASGTAEVATKVTVRKP